MILDTLLAAVPWYVKAAAAIALCAALAAFGWLKGAEHVQAQWDAATAKESARVAIVRVKQTEATVRVVTDYVDRVRVIKEKGATLIREVPVHVPAESNAGCAIPAGFVRLHDAAAVGLPLPRAPAALDARAADAQDAAQ